MNRKPVIAAAVFAAMGTSAFAVEAEQVVAPQGQLTRSEVQAEYARARAAGELAYANESYGGVKQQVFAARAGAIALAVSRDRDEARAEGRAAARAGKVNTDYVGG